MRFRNVGWLMFIPLAVTSAQPPAGEDGAGVYQRVLKSTAWIHSPRGPGSVSTGSGSLIDVKHRLILTNYHVVADVERTNVFFPSYRDGKVIAEKTYYQDNSTRLRWPGKVVARDRMRDLALIQLENLPPNVVALPLSTRGVAPGQTVHSIGNPGPSGALWVYTPGKVRQVYFKRWRAKLEDREATFEAEVIETDSPTNPGDSGGPLVNDRGELVGVTQGGALQANSLSTFIDISEVRKFLTGPQVKPTGFKLRNRPVALLSSDGGRFFSDESLKFVNDTAKELFAKSGRDVIVETYASIPGGKSAEVKAMSVADREKFFRDWTKARMESEDIDGILLVVTREPSHLHFEVTSGSKVSAEDVKKLREALLAKFREKKFDDGVRDFVKESARLVGN